MKKLLIASTALSLAGGAAFAEMAITVSGDAELGVDYASEPGCHAGGASKHSFVHEVGIDFTASGTTDGGLTFGGTAGFDTGDTDLNTGTVHVSGSFGTLTIGDNDAADLTAGGIADIGMNGIGVDDMVEGLRGTTACATALRQRLSARSRSPSRRGRRLGRPVAAVPASKWMITTMMEDDHPCLWCRLQRPRTGPSTPDEGYGPNDHGPWLVGKDDGTYHYLGDLGQHRSGG